MIYWPGPPIPGFSPMARHHPKLVYSTDPARRPPPAGPARPARPARSLPPEQQTAAIRREKKGRGGKTVTVVYELQLSPEDLKALAKTLKSACGTGGTVKDGTIEIQGDFREAVAARLQALGYRTKFSGG